MVSKVVGLAILHQCQLGQYDNGIRKFVIKLYVLGHINSGLLCRVYVQNYRKETKNSFQNFKRKCSFMFISVMSVR